VEEQGGDLLGLEFLRERPGPTLSAKNGGQEQAGQNRQDAHHAKQLDQGNPCGDARLG
jgi:hypothetical protein